MEEARNGRKAAVVTLVVLMAFSYLPLVTTAGSVGHIWLNCDPGERARGIGGWPAGGFICPAEFEPNLVYTFTLIVENRDKDPLVDLRIAMAISVAGTVQTLREATSSFSPRDAGLSRVLTTKSPSSSSPSVTLVVFNSVGSSTATTLGL